MTSPICFSACWHFAYLAIFALIDMLLGLALSKDVIPSSLYFILFYFILFGFGLLLTVGFLLLNANIITLNPLGRSSFNWRVSSYKRLFLAPLNFILIMSGRLCVCVCWPKSHSQPKNQVHTNLNWGKSETLRRYIVLCNLLLSPALSWATGRVSAKFGHTSCTLGLD